MTSFVGHGSHSLRVITPVVARGLLSASKDCDETEEYDWLAPVEGGLLPLPPDAWEVAAA